MGNLTNIYWPVYKNLESELIKLSYNIQIDDTQLSVYSAQIADLILRGAIEIESIAKELCRQENTHNDIHKFDFDCVAGLNSKWELDKKIVVISGSTCYQTQRILIPFEKNEINIKNRPICSWNNSYQYLKHDKVNSLKKYGNIKYLFDTMAALFLLNIYYKKEIINLGNDQTGNNFPIGLGSEIFTIKIKKFYENKLNISEYTYRMKYTDSFNKKLQDMMSDMNRQLNESFLRHPKFSKFIQEKGIDAIKQNQGGNIFWEALGQDDYIRVLQNSPIVRQFPEIMKQSEYEAILTIPEVKI